jgi:hypothetical protein
MSGWPRYLPDGNAEVASAGWQLARDNWKHESIPPPPKKNTLPRAPSPGAHLAGEPRNVEAPKAREPRLCCKPGLQHEAARACVQQHVARLHAGDVDARDDMPRRRLPRLESRGPGLGAGWG